MAVLVKMPKEIHKLNSEKTWYTSFSFKPDANGCMYISKHFVYYSAPCGYRHNSCYLYRPDTGTGFLITERQSFSWQTRWLWQSSLHERSLQTSAVQWHSFSSIAIRVSVVCFCFLVFWVWWRRKLPISPSCANTTEAAMWAGREI